MNKPQLTPKLRTLLVTALLLSTWSTGWAQPAASTPSGEEAKKRMMAARDEIANVRSNIFLTLVDLDKIRGERQPHGPAFQVFTNQFAQMEVLVKALAKRAEEMKRRGDAYFQDWEARTSAIQNPQSRQHAEKRYDERKTLYQGIGRSMQDARTNFASFMTDLTEITALLEGPRTQENIAKAKDLFMHANWRCIDVQRALMEIEDRFDRLAASFAKDE